MSRPLVSLAAALLMILALATQASAQSKVSVDNVTTEYNVYRQNTRGLVIHVRFRTNSLMTTTCHAAAYFYWPDGRKVQHNGNYATPSGHLCTGSDFTPHHNQATFNDFQLFIPYTAFPLTNKGRYAFKYQLRFYVKADNSNLALTPFHPMAINKN